MCAIAELMQLTSLQLLHGSIAPGLVLAHWSSLKQLAELTLLPAEQAGLGDAQVRGGCGIICVQQQQQTTWPACGLQLQAVMH